ncbi:MAG: hypothetical protein KF773_32115 [Deltaproteobacteria bacterium]|nr:hypothetical protein [Deltaproteobacteria bacterium]MCW5807725.1 hypothetical protein [Deltaproteobacteria bacterium]
MRAFLAASLLALVGAAGCNNDDDDLVEAALIVSNQSDFTIEQIFLTEVDNPNFGPNLIAGEVLLPGEELTLGVNCGTFDVLIVDEAGVECTLHALDLCANAAKFIIRNDTCTVFGARKAQEEAAAKSSDLTQAL